MTEIAKKVEFPKTWEEQKLDIETFYVKANTP